MEKNGDRKKKKKKKTPYADWSLSQRCSRLAAAVVRSERCAVLSEWKQGPFCEGVWTGQSSAVRSDQRQARPTLGTAQPDGQQGVRRIGLWEFYCLLLGGTTYARTLSPSRSKKKKKRRETSHAQARVIPPLNHQSSQFLQAWHCHGPGPWEKIAFSRPALISVSETGLIKSITLHQGLRSRSPASREAFH